MSFPHSDKCTVAVIGLGYVGLPLAIELSKNKNNCVLNKQLERKIIGFDINQNRLEELKKNQEITLSFYQNT